MATVTVDIIDGHGLRKSAENGYETDRIAIVTGVTGDGSARLYNAVNTTGVPAIGDAHPDIAVAHLRSIDARPKDSDTVELVLKYRESTSTHISLKDDPEISVGASVSQIETNKDADDNVIAVQYTYPSTYTKREEYAGKTHDQGGLVSRLMPQRTYTVRKRLSATASQIEATNDIYQGKVNAFAWRGYQPRTWLCVGISGQSNDGGQTYAVTYQFQYNPYTWDTVVTFIDPNDGKPPINLDANGVKYVKVYNEIDFAGLGIS